MEWNICAKKRVYRFLCRNGVAFQSLTWRRIVLGLILISAKVFLSLTHSLTMVPYSSTCLLCHSIGTNSPFGTVTLHRTFPRPRWRNCRSWRWPSSNSSASKWLSLDQCTCHTRKAHAHAHLPREREREEEEEERERVTAVCCVGSLGIITHSDRCRFRAVTFPHLLFDSKIRKLFMRSKEKWWERKELPSRAPLHPFLVL